MRARLPTVVGALCAAFALLATLPSPARADEEAPAAQEGAPPADFVSTRNIEDKLREAKQIRASRLNFGVRDAVARIDAMVYKKTRIRFAGIYTFLYQKASGGDGPREAAGGDLDVIGTWDAIQRGGRTTGALEAAFEGRHRVGDLITPSALSLTIDSLWPTTSGFNQQDFSLIQVYWRQQLLGGRLQYRIGKLSPYSTFFGNRLNSSSLFFVNFAFADNPAVFMPGNGFGLHVTWQISPKWSVSGGVQDANGVKTEIDPSTLKNGEFWAALQVTLQTNIPGLGEGTYRLGGWYVTPREAADQPAGAGTVLSLDQALGKKVIGFLRYEWQGEGLLNPEVQFKALTGTLSALRGGVGISGPIPAWPDDYLGLALAWGVPSGDLAKDSYVGEVFYRSQVADAAQLTLSLQMIRSSTVFEQVYVLSVRFRVEL